MPPTRSRWLALILTFVSPGLGQLYNGQPGKALLFPLGLPVVALSLFALLPHMPYNAWSLLPLGVLGLVLVASVTTLATHAWDTASRLGSRFKPRPFNRWWVYVLFILGSYAVTSGTLRIRDRVSRWYLVPAGSMVPTLQAGDRILMDGTAYLPVLHGLHTADGVGAGPRRGDVIVFRYPRDQETPYVKRVIGLPGERVEIRSNLVYIDGHALDEPYATWGTPESYGPATVGPDAYFVLGDNRANSSDSRFWGTVPRNLVLGKVDRVLWSRDSAGRLRLDRLGAPVR